MIETAEFKPGAKLEVDGEPFSIINHQHVKPGKGGAFVRTKLKNLRTGNTLERTFRSGESFAVPDIAEQQMQFLYGQGDEYHFMDVGTYEQTFLTATQMGTAKDFLKEQMLVTITSYRGKPLEVILPNFVELRISQTDPGVRGDTATGGSKIAKLESGGTVKVPLFIEEGEVIKVDTRTGTYIERV